MKELLFALPALLLVALTLGGTRGETLPAIFRESRRSFVKITILSVVFCVAVQIVLYLVPIFY